MYLEYFHFIQVIPEKSSLVIPGKLKKKKQPKYGVLVWRLPESFHNFMMKTGECENFSSIVKCCRNIVVLLYGSTLPALSPFSIPEQNCTTLESDDRLITFSCSFLVKETSQIPL